MCGLLRIDEKWNRVKSKFKILLHIQELYVTLIYLFQPRIEFQFLECNIYGFDYFIKEKDEIAAMKLNCLSIKVEYALRSLNELDLLGCGIELESRAGVTNLSFTHA